MAVAETMTVDQLVESLASRPKAAGRNRISVASYARGESTEGDGARDGLVYSCPSLKVVSAVKDAGSNDGVVMTFDAVITSSRQDRDGDRLLSDGAELDENMPLLWQHDWRQPIGRFLGVQKRTKSRIVGSFAVADTPLGRDAATLIGMGALRISHGFVPKEWEEIRKPNGDFVGWEISKFEIFETSLVSVPSNIDAIVTAFDRKQLCSPELATFAKSLKNASAPPKKSEATLSISLDDESKQTLHAIENATKGLVAAGAIVGDAVANGKTVMERVADVLLASNAPLADLVILRSKVRAEFEKSIADLDAVINGIDAAEKRASLLKVLGSPGA